MYSSKKTGARIRAFRRDKGYTSAKTALALHISPDHLRKLERGERNPSLDLLITMSEYLDVSIDDLLKGPSDKTLLRDELSSVIKMLETIRQQME